MGLEITNNVAPFDEILVLLREKISRDPENLTIVRIYSRVISSGVASVHFCQIVPLHGNLKSQKRTSLQYLYNSEFHSSSCKLVFLPPFRLWNRFMELQILHQQVDQQKGTAGKVGA